MLYFAYGSNLHPKHLRERCPGIISLGKARLPGYRIGFRYPSTSFPGGSAADIILDPDSEVWGALYEINTQDLERLDGFEDLATDGYRRIKVEVIHNERHREAWSYEVVNKLSDDYRPMPSYLDLAIRGARAHGIPEGYVRELSRIAIEAPPLSF